MSLWTKTPMFVPTRGPLLIQTLAANLAARVFAETEFVTDKRGAEIAALLGWPFGEKGCCCNAQATSLPSALAAWPALAGEGAAADSSADCSTAVIAAAF